jgi:hypothetical protein
MKWIIDHAKETFTEDLYKISGKFMVLIPGTWEEMTFAETDLLSKILGAIRVPLSKVQIISGEHADVIHLALFNPAFILGFGVAVNGIEKKYSLVEHQGLELILADRLSEIDIARKEKLWPELRDRFLPSKKA